MTVLDGGRDRRALILGLGICVAIWSVARGFPALRALYSDKLLDVRELASQAAVLRHAAGSTRSLVDSLAARRRTFDVWAARLVRGATANAAAANATGYLSQVAEDHGVQLGAVQVITDTATAQQLRHVTLVASATGDVRGLLELLATLETGSPLMRVRSIAISQPQVMASGEVPETLSAQMTLDALAIIGTSK